jgi:DNA repair protein RadC
MADLVQCTKSAQISLESAHSRRAASCGPAAWRAITLRGASVRELIDLLLAHRRAPSPQDLDESWLAQHAHASAAELAAQLGVPWRAGLRLACALELGRRISAHKPAARAPVRTPRDAFDLLRDSFVGRDRETVIALDLDGRHRLRQLHEVSVGTATASLIHPREVFGPALRLRACAVVVAHNHPSGDPEPSAEDRGVTERLHAAGELVGVPLLDHLVVGGEAFISLRGRGSWAQPARPART